MSNLKKIITGRKNCKSVWFMRQAGRYLPEFKKIRANNKNFIELCLNSKLSSEITLQPIKRFDIDSAIIFSDILMVPFALGQNVKFVKGKGPVLDAFNLERFHDNNPTSFIKNLEPVYKAIEMTRQKLTKEKSLIAFIGAPWTLLIYMFGAKENNTINFDKIKVQKPNLSIIFNMLIEYLCIHIKKQIEAGADVVQIFDSWAGLLPTRDLPYYCYEPNLKITEFCKNNKIPTICFPKGIKENYKNFNDIVKPNGINLDSELNPVWAKKKLKNVVLQGGLDPKILFLEKEKIEDNASRYFNAFKGIPYIFNLGHGLLPETDPDKVSELIQFYRKYKT